MVHTPPRGPRRRRRAALLAAAALALTAAAPAAALAAASPTALDPTLSGDGKLIASTPGLFETVNAVAVQPDRKILVAGTVAADGAGLDGDDAFVERLNPDGSADTTFGDAGRKTIDVGGFDDGAYALALDAGGRILVAGYTSDAAGYNHKDFLVARLTPDGAPDPSFSGDGLQTIDFGGGAEEAHALALQPDGAIVVGGSAQPGSDTVLGLARLTADGALDPAFDGDGRVTTAVPGDSSAQVNGVAVDGSGRIVAAGRAYLGSGNFELALARYASNGTLDDGFGTHGIQTAQAISPADDLQPVGVAVRDGGIVVGAFEDAADGMSIDGRFAALRYDDTGAPDPAFGTGGMAVVPFPTPDGTIYQHNAYATGGPVFLSDGTIVLAGRDTYYNEFFEEQTRFALVGLTPAGQPDPRFGDGGAVVTPLDAPVAEGKAVALDHGRIVVAGDAVPGGSSSDVALARYTGIPTAHALTAAVGGDGTGTVTGGGLSCPGTCTAQGDDGDAVTLTATPADGSTFTGWSGACSGTATTCTLTPLTDTTVTATFAKVAAPPAGGTTTTPVVTTPAPAPAGTTAAACVTARAAVTSATRAATTAKTAATRAQRAYDRARTATRRATKNATHAKSRKAKRRAAAVLRTARRHQASAQRTLKSARTKVTRTQASLKKARAQAAQLHC
jgi:uncharacterized delta-60 repeat protein